MSTKLDNQVLRILGESTGNVVAALEGLKLQIAQCIPSTCSATELKAALNVFLKRNPSLKNIQADVNPDQCHTIKKGYHLRAVDWFAIGFLIFFIIIAAASTAYDLLCRMKEVKGSPILLSFSVYSNWLRLISINSSSETMTAVNGIRFISMGWVVLGHRYLVVSGLPSINMVYLNDFKKDWSRLTIMNGTLSVDTFFLLSGLLTSYVFLKEMEKRGRFNILLFYVHRYIRLTPALAVMILMTVTLFNYGGEGPLWDSRHRTAREACEKNWWANLLYINNYYDSGTMCLGQTWYLAVDMQLHFLSPLILIPLWKKPRLSQLLLIVLMLTGWGAAFTVPYVEEYWAGVWTGPVELRTISQQKNYYPTHTRFMPWVMGIALGYWIREAKKTKFRMTSFQIALGWILSTFLMLGSMHLAYPFQQPEYVYNRLESSFYISLFRPAWSLGVAWIIFASDLGYGGFPNIILSWRIFQPLGRLSYGIYLTHVPVLSLLTAGIRTPVYLADVNAIPDFMGDLLISIGLAIPLVLLFESPIILLEKRLLGPQDSSNTQPNHEGVRTLERQLAELERQKGGV
ncbi:nose resistant to fluoxetine protein 6 [Anabrus simplex]|uniref:nose resistant to fluoxetine protein 6 n=1 Tax=Anabrus simplex TaxID=316456 RepID=UPI0035A3CA3B